MTQVLPQPANGSPHFWASRGARAIEPYQELGAYESLWLKEGMWFDKLAKMFGDSDQSLPSDFVAQQTAQISADKVLSSFRDKGMREFGIRVHGAGEYPDRLRDANHPIELLYFRGIWELASSPKLIAIVGTRNPTEDGIKRTRKLVKLLVKHGFTIVSGLAKGIDTAAHTAALEAGGRTIAVIGTPLDETYPKENASLQASLARDHLVISQVPVLRYKAQDYRRNRLFFPERNVTMSALTLGTIIVEASETSGTLTQARAALQQKRKLFILDSCFKNPNITWPHTFHKRGAIRVEDINDILGHLQVETPEDRRPQP